MSIRSNKGLTGPGGDPTDTIDYKETSDLIAKDNISNEVLNSIFNDLKFNSSVDISDLSKFYKDGKILTADELTSIIKVWILLLLYMDKLKIAIMQHLQTL